MFLAIDIGNTHTVVGVYKGASLLHEWRIASARNKTEDEAGAQVRLLFNEAKLPATIAAAGISSVVPDLTDVYIGMVKKYFHQEPFEVSAALDLGIKIHYANPMAVGADRICNAVAGYAKYGGPLLIVDFGTATTYDIVGANGDYIGGVIAPGVETSAGELHRRAAKLPKIELRFPPSIIGADTEESMQAGILYGAVDALNGMVRRLQEEVLKREGKPARVIATGGFSRIISKETDVIQALEPSLVLEGIRLIHERITAKRKKR